MKALVAADTFATFTAFLWLYLFRMVAAHYDAQPAYGRSGAWDFWVYLPLGLGLSVLIAIGFFTFVKRRPKTVALVGTAALFLMLPYGMMLSGGV